MDSTFESWPRGPEFESRQSQKSSFTIWTRSCQWRNPLLNIAYRSEVMIEKPNYVVLIPEFPTVPSMLHESINGKFTSKLERKAADSMFFLRRYHSKSSRGENIVTGPKLFIRQAPGLATPCSCRLETASNGSAMLLSWCISIRWLNAIGCS